MEVVAAQAFHIMCPVHDPQVSERKLGVLSVTKSESSVQKPKIAHLYIHLQVSERKLGVSPD